MKRVSKRTQLRNAALALTGLAVMLLAASAALQAGNGTRNEQRQERLTRLRMSAYVHYRNPSKAEEERRVLVDTLLSEAGRLRIPGHFNIEGKAINPVYFLAALIAVESSFDRQAVSRSDARGYMQLKPDTAAWLDRRLDEEGRLLPQDVAATRLAFASVTLRPAADPRLRRELFTARDNLRRGVAYLNFLIDGHPDIRMVCLAYNAGPASVARGLWDERYWIKVLQSYREIASGRYQASNLRSL